MAKTEKTTDMSVNNEKLKALKLTMDKLEKDYGKGSVMMLGDKTETQQEVISTGSIGVDAALGVGGVPRGRIIEIFGPESSGKTTLTLTLIGTIQALIADAALLFILEQAELDQAQLLAESLASAVLDEPGPGQLDDTASHGLLLRGLAALHPLGHPTGLMEALAERGHEVRVEVLQRAGVESGCHKGM